MSATRPNSGGLQCFECMRFFLSFFCCGVLCLLGCAGTSHLQERQSRRALAKIADVHASTNDLLSALRSLRDSGLTNEPPQFWSAIANNPQYSVDHRSRAVLQLFARHFHSGMTLGNIAELLNHPRWLHEKDVLVPRAWMGPSPFERIVNDEYPFVWIRVINSPAQRDNIAPIIYLSIRGDTQRKEVFECLKGNTNTSVQNIVVDEIASQEHVGGKIPPS